VFETVVVGVTESDGPCPALRRAMEVTKASGGVLHVVCACRKAKAAPYLPEEFRYTDAGAGATDWFLAQVCSNARAEGITVTPHPVSADPAEAITRVAADERADLIVVGSGAAHGSRHLSSVPKAVMDRAACAVLVV
jgi:nucleotide-binding universal stress UspA family protein